MRKNETKTKTINKTNPSLMRKNETKTKIIILIETNCNLMRKNETNKNHNIN